MHQALVATILGPSDSSMITMGSFRTTVQVAERWRSMESQRKWFEHDHHAGPSSAYAMHVTRTRSQHNHRGSIQHALT